MEVILRPDWKGEQFRRTIKSGKSSRVMTFRRRQPVTLSAAEAKALQADIGRVLVEVQRDEKDRIRYVESEPAPQPEAIQPKQEPHDESNL